MENKCRLCLIKCEDDSLLKNIFDGKIDENLICDEVRRFAGIEVVEDDVFPKGICQMCFDKLIEVVKFRKKIIFSEFSLQEIVAKENEKEKLQNTVHNVDISDVNSSSKVNLMQDEVACFKEDLQLTKDWESDEDPTISTIHLKNDEEDNSFFEIASDDSIHLNDDEDKGFLQKDNTSSEILINNDSIHMNRNGDKKLSNKGSKIASNDDLRYMNKDNSCEIADEDDSPVSESIGDDVEHEEGESNNSWWEDLKEEEAGEVKSTCDADTKTTKWYCKECEKQFKNRYYYRNHTSQYHRGMHTCNVCNKAFPVRYQLVNHLRAHTGERPFACEVCGKTYMQHSPLIAHRHRHFKDKTFECDVCQKKFIDVHVLKLHKISHSEERRYVCEICSKAYKSSTSLAQHLPMHSGEKTVPCPDCDKMFPSHLNMNAHRKIHRSKKIRYKCDECDKDFSSVPCLKNHKHVHSGAKPYECRLCQKTFRQTSILFRHMRVHTGETPYPYVEASNSKQPIHSSTTEHSDQTDIESGSEYTPSEDSTSINESEDSNNSNQNVKDSTEALYSEGFEADHSLIEVDIPAPSPSQEKKKFGRRKHHCQFCYQIIGNYVRHMERKHADETQVQEFMNLKKRSQKRKKLIDKLRREGDFQSSEIIPVMQGKTRPENFNVCIFCRGYYSSKTLRRHVKTCFFNPDPKKKTYALKDGHTLMCGPFSADDPLKKSGLLNMMNPDEISSIAKKDKLICEVGRRYIKKHKDKRLLIVAKRYMRRLARLLQCMMELEENKKLRLVDILHPQKFKKIVQATKTISGYDCQQRTYKSPSLAFQMGTLIRQAVDTCFSIENKKAKGSQEHLDRLRELKILICTDWASEISSEAGQNFKFNRFNKPTVSHAAGDIKKFDTYLKKLIDKSRVSLENDSNDIQAFRALSEGIFCNVQLYNRRRVAEVQKISLQSYLKNSEITASSELEKILTNTEIILLNTLKIVVVREKRGREVPVLFNKKIVEAIEFLISKWNNFSLQSNIYLFGVPNTNNSINGYMVMRKHVKHAFGTVDKVSILMSTRLRKHLATITQIFNMEKTELEQLATFMGHTEKTYCEFYTLPDDVFQTAKMSKLLLLSQKSDLEKFKGKSLIDLDLGDELVEELDEDEQDQQEIQLDEAEIQTKEENIQLNEGEIPEVKKYKNCENNTTYRPIRRVLTPWSSEEKKATESFFKTHIKKRMPPKKNEVEILKMKHPKIFGHRTWEQIKVYVYNKYKKKYY